MACVTLKRPFDWESLPGLAPRQAKRRRFAPFSTAAAAAHRHPLRDTPSAFQDVAPRLTSEFIATSVCNEALRLQRRKILQSATQGPLSPNSSGSASSPPGTSDHSSTPLFTFKQVNMICERVLREREDELREHYDQVLNEKLAEQYDAFVRFTQDQIHRRFANEAAPSYCS